MTEILVESRSCTILPAFSFSMDPQGNITGKNYNESNLGTVSRKANLKCSYSLPAFGEPSTLHWRKSNSANGATVVGRENVVCDLQLWKDSEAKLGSSESKEPLGSQWNIPPNSFLKYSWYYKVNHVFGRIPQSLINWGVVFPCLALGVWGAIFSCFGPDEAYPGKSLFSLFALVVVAIVFGEMTNLILLPPALGMLIAGLMLGNVPFFSWAQNLSNDLYEPLRAMAVSVLLIRGALSVNPAGIALYKLVGPQLCLFSCLTEAGVYTMCAVFILQMPLPWALMTGFIISTMSGAIVTQGLTAVETKLGKKDEAISIVKTACGLDAIFGICMSLCVLGFIVANNDVEQGLQEGVVEVAFGGAFGIGWGIIAGLILNGSHGNSVRVAAIFLGGVTSMLGMTQLNCGRGGPAAAFFGTLIAATMWRERHVDGINNDELQASFTTSWFFFQPVLFGLIGYRLDFSLVDWDFVARGALCLAISLTGRSLAAGLMTTCANITWKQRTFIAMAWIPKGTVQAALGCVALDTVTGLGAGASAVGLGLKVMHLCVLTAILTSSLGYLSLRTVGPMLLQ